MERCGPPRTITSPVPLTDRAELAVWCMIINGVGSETGLTPQVALAEMFTEGLEFTNRVKLIGTESVTVTCMYGNGVASAGGSGATPETELGKLTRTFAPL